MDVADSSAAPTKVPPSQPKHNLSPSRTKFPLTPIHTINECIMPSFRYTQSLTHTNAQKCSRVEKSLIRTTLHPKSLPETHYSYAEHAHKCCLQYCANMFNRNSAAGTQKPNASFQILTLQLRSCVTPVSKCLGFLNCKMGMMIIITPILWMDVTNEFRYM